MSTITPEQDLATATKDAQARQAALDAYVARKKALRKEWDTIAALRGDEYSRRMTKYSAARRQLRKDWDAFVQTYGG